MMFCELVHGREYERASKPFLGLSPDFPQELQPELWATPWVGGQKDGMVPLLGGGLDKTWSSNFHVFFNFHTYILLLIFRYVWHESNQVQSCYIENSF